MPRQKKHALPSPGDEAIPTVGHNSKIITPEYLARTGSEHGHQAAVFCWAVEYAKVDPRIHYMYACPNGGLRNPATAANLKAEGVKRGVPDIFLPVTCTKYAGLYIEMKKPKVGKASEFQDDYKNFLISQHYMVVECRTWESARDIIIRYLWNAR